jgi:SAM-dependent methyltransferase
MEDWQDIRLQKIAKIVSDNCKGNERILDVGCYNRHIRPKLPKNINYTGLDVQGECDVKCDLNEGKLPFKDKVFDGMICCEIFEHVKKPKDLLKEMRRVMKDDGFGVVSIPNENHIIIRLRRLFNLPYTGLVFEDNPQRHIHSPRLIEGINFINSEFKIIKKKYYTSKPKLQWLANLRPALFARGTIMEVKK